MIIDYLLSKIVKLHSFVKLLLILNGSFTKMRTQISSVLNLVKWVARVHFAKQHRYTQITSECI